MNQFWDCFYDPRSSSRSQVMVILVIHLQFHFPSPLLFNGLWHITLCTFTYHHACNMVMIEVLLCVASISLCYTATLDPAGAWEIASTRTPPFISKPDKHRSSGGGPANEDYNIMVCRICINRFWLVGSKATILNGFPLLYMYSWCQSSTMDAN